MADLDEISMLLGEIRSDVKHMRNDFNQVIVWQEAHEEKDQERFERLTTRIDASNHVRSRVDQVERDLQAAQPVLEGITRAKWVVIGAVTAIGAIGGAFGGWAMSLVKLIA